MRTEQEMLDLILETARNDERIRAVVMNGSRANPNAPRDSFQDFDIIYVVTDVPSFRHDPAWIGRFGELMILQMPEDMRDPPPRDDEAYSYLMQFADGNRIDLWICPLAQFRGLCQDPLGLLLLDKDGSLTPYPPPSENAYLPTPPTAKVFADCCNEFWWVSAYVAKGLWRREITYAKHMMEHYVRKQLMCVLAWYVGVGTEFSKNPGKFGKYLERYLEPELWALLLQTYSDAGYEHTWDALFCMGDLFRKAAVRVAGHFSFDYPHDHDARLTAHFRHVRSLPADATDIY